MSEELKILEDFPATTKEQWRVAADKLLKGKPFDKVLVKKTYEGIDIQPIYFQDELDKLPFVNSLPGEVPYVRGNSAAGATVGGWEIAQEITEPDPEEFNAALKNDLSKGQNAINIVFGKATLNGRDPGEAPAEEVGFGGLSVASVADMAKALDGVDLTGLPLHVETGASGVALTALLAAYLKKQGKSPAALKGCFGMDPLATLATDGSLASSLEAAYNQMAQTTLWAKTNAPALKTICVNATPYQHSGASAVQEVAYAIATGAEYIRQMMDRGLGINDIAPRMMFTLAISNDFFMEIAKFRAARLAWCGVVTAFGGNDESKKMFIHARTSSYNKTKVDPWVNMLRVTTEAFSAVAGGCESIHVSPFDEVIRQPNEFSRRIARNVQILLRHEAHFDEVVDPAGGCWYVEAITGELAKKIWAGFQAIEGKGGMAKALAGGIPQEQTAAIAAQRTKAIAVRKDRIVGTNMYPNLQEKPIQEEELDFEAFQKDRSKATAAAKGNCKAALDKLAGAKATVSAAVVDAAVEAAAAGATLGDLTKTLATNGGVSITPLCIHRVSEPFEKIRRATEAYSAKTGGLPNIFMANMGPIPQHKLRSDFCVGYVNVGMFDTISPAGFDTPEAAADAAVKSGAKATIICSTDETYPDIVPAFCKKVKAAKPDMMVIVAGLPKDHVDAFKQAGVDEFLHAAGNCLDLLTKIQKHLGVIA